VRPELERIEIPGEHDARERARSVLESAFAERVPAERRTRRWRPAFAIAIVAAALAAVLSSPGRAVLDDLREVVGVQRAQPALFSLPSDGRLLVASDAGVWVVRHDGSKRLLGPYREASWSPFGRFVVAARENELAALEPDGDVRWTLARSRVSGPRWTGSDEDTRIAYSSRGAPRFVAGDGTDDRPTCAAHASGVPSVWRPGAGFVLALAAPNGAVSVVDVDNCATRWTSQALGAPRKLEWSSDGARVLVLSRTGIHVLDGRTGRSLSAARGYDASFRPGTQQLASVRQQGGASIVSLRGRTVFRAVGNLGDLTWSPDGRWILVTWPTADQWVLVRADGRRIRAVGNISEQFRSRVSPRVEGWCCRE
jgi:hypothetical protein